MATASQVQDDIAAEAADATFTKARAVECMKVRKNLATVLRDSGLEGFVKVIAARQQRVDVEMTATVVVEDTVETIDLPVPPPPPPPAPPPP